MSETALTCTRCGWHRFPGERCENCARLQREADARADTGPKPGSIFYIPNNDIDRKLHKRRLKQRILKREQLRHHHGRRRRQAG